MKQLDILLRSRSTDPASSSRAAARARPKANSDAGRVLSFIERYPGEQARAIAAAISLHSYIVRKRTADLRRAGFAHSHLPQGEELTWWPGAKDASRCSVCRYEEGR